MARIRKYINFFEEKIFSGREFKSKKEFIKKIRDFVVAFINLNKEEIMKSKDVKTMIYNISVPESDKVMKEIIEKGSINPEEIKEKIKKLEEEINQLVYKLYGITSEEQKIIEESLIHR